MNIFGLGAEVFIWFTEIQNIKWRHFSVTYCMYRFNSKCIKV